MSKVDSFTTGQLTKIFGLAKARELVSDKTQLVLENGIFADFIEAVALGRPTDRNEFRKALGLPSLDDKLIELLGFGIYDWIDPRITPVTFPVTVIPELSHHVIYRFNDDVDIMDAISEIDRDGNRNTTMAELLVYGAKYPNAQMREVIVAINSAVLIDYCVHVGKLGTNDRGRHVELEELNLSGCSVLTVPK